jgi:hypothetical protein
MGKDVSHGCVRHYNEDIVTIFDAVAVGDYVAIVSSVSDSRLKAPKLQGRLRLFRGPAASGLSAPARSP